MKLRKTILLILSVLTIFALVGCSNKTTDAGNSVDTIDTIAIKNNEEPKQEFYRSIVVEEVIGEVKVLHADGNELQAYEGMSLVDGDSVNVGNESSLTLKVDSDKNLLAEAGTKFTLDAKGTEESNQTRILLDDGSVLCEINEKLKDDESFVVVTASSTMSVRGTVFKSSVIKSTDGNVAYDVVEVFEGTVWSKLENSENDYDVVVEKGTCAAVKQATSTSAAGYIPGNLINDDFFKNPGNYETTSDLEKVTAEVSYEHLSKTETERLTDLINSEETTAEQKKYFERIRDAIEIQTVIEDGVEVQKEVTNINKIEESKEEDEGSSGTSLFPIKTNPSSENKESEDNTSDENQVEETPNDEKSDESNETPGSSSSLF